MQKINEVAIGKTQQSVSLKALTFLLHCITMYFADIKFRNKESVTTQAFAFFRFQKQTPKSSLRLRQNLHTDYKINTKGAPDLVSEILPCTATFELAQTCRHDKKIHIDGLIMTAW